MINLEIKKIKKLYSSIEFISNVPLPEITYEEEILLNIDFNNIYIKTEKYKYSKCKNTDSLNDVLELNIKENIIKKDIDSNTKPLELKDVYTQTNINTSQTSEIEKKYIKLEKEHFILTKKYEKDILRSYAGCVTCIKTNKHLKNHISKFRNNLLIYPLDKIQKTSFSDSKKIKQNIDNFIKKIEISIFEIDKSLNET